MKELYSRTYYGVVINTNKIADNFVAEMTAYITNKKWDHEVDNKYFNKFDKYDFAEVKYKRFGHVNKPCCVDNYTNGKDQDVVIFFYNKPNKRVLKTIEERAKMFNEENITINRVYAIEFKETVTEI